MKPSALRSRFKTIGVACALAFLLASAPSHALRCGNKLVKDGMLAAQVTAICGEPVSIMYLGSVVRYYDPYEDRGGLTYYTRRHGYGARAEMRVVEMLFNFGPNKLMRRIRFEGGKVTGVETAGYGYREE